jgi:DNA repair exonuclease SbcCD ATPase subunit
MTSEIMNLEVSNVGGVGHTEIEFSPGVTVLSGKNATNRTSILNALMAGFGSNRPSIKTGEESGYVSLRLGDQQVKREVSVTGGDSHWDGDGLVDDIDDFHLFCSLLRDNKMRQAVANGDNLYDLIMQPVDTDKIRSRMSELKQRRDEIEDREEELPSKRSQIQELQNEIESKEAQLETKRADLDDMEAEIEAVDEQDTQSDTLEESRELNRRIRDLSSDKADLEDSIDILEEQLSTRINELDQLQSSEWGDISELNSRIESIGSDLSRLESNVEELEADKRALTPLRQFLSQVAGGDTSRKEINRVFEKYGEGSTTPSDDDETMNPTDVLLQDDDGSKCVLCGTDIGQGHYDEMLSTVNATISTITSKRDDIQKQIDELRSDREELKTEVENIRQNKDRVAELESKIDSIQAEIEDNNDDLEAVTAELEEDQQELDEFEDEVESKSEDATSKLRSLEQEKTKIEIDIDSLVNDIESHEREISTLKDDVDEIKTQVSEVKPELNEQLDELRGEVDRIEASIVDQFNETMSEIITRLDYDTIDRIWIEKKIRQVKDGRKTVEKTFFQLNVARNVGGSTANEVVSNLSESERTVTSLVFALTGYIVHDVGERIPVVMMDSVEMIDAQRLEALLEYVKDDIEYLIVTTLPEDTDAMSIESVIKNQGEYPRL